MNFIAKKIYFITHKQFAIFDDSVDTACCIVFRKFSHGSVVHLHAGAQGILGVKQWFSSQNTQCLHYSMKHI